MKTDSIFYRLFLELPEVFFRLIGKSPTLADSYQFRSVEIKQTSFRLDGVLVPDTESKTTPIFFCEMQMQKDEAFYRRFFAEIFLYLHQYDKAQHWQAVVVFPKRTKEPRDIQPYRSLLRSKNFTRIYLEDLGDEAYEDPGLGIVKLIVEAKKNALDRAKELSAKTQTEIADEPTRQKMLELMTTILLYKFKNLNSQEVIKMLGLEDFEKSRLYKDMSRRIRKQVKEQLRNEFKDEVRDEVKDEVRDEVKDEVRNETRDEFLTEGKLLTVPLLLELGLSVEEIARRLNLTTEQVQQVARSQSN